MTRLRVLAGLLVLVCALVGAAPASAAPRTKAAAAFSDAALHARVALKQQAPEIERRTKELNPELCGDVIQDVAKAKRSLRRAVPFAILGLFQPTFDALASVSRQLVAELDAVPTNDRALIAGREGWRTIVALLEAMPRADRPCERLAEWRDSGWSADKRPPLFDEDLFADDTAATRNLARAQRRLRQLGVSRAAARRFTGETFLDGIDAEDAMFDVVAGEPEVRPAR